MRVGNMDVFSAGEPLSGRAVLDKVGFTIASSQQSGPTIRRRWWRLRPTSEPLPKECCGTGRRPAGRGPSCRRGRPEAIAPPRFMDDYDDGRGKKWKDKHRVSFFADGNVTQPLVSDTLWFLTQQQRWKMIDIPPARMLEVARKVTRTDIYSKGAAMARVPLSKNEGRKATMVDGPLWDPARFADYAGGFKIKA